jgi:putative ubiquitin-RnfH superfamily antitoxin RatB of RatAB toxin-antitoxin module
MPVRKTITVEVVFALPERQELVTVTVPSASKAGEAVDRSAIAHMFPEQDLSVCAIGVWGKLVDRDHVLQDGDRIEIYRPLFIDPREARRQLAAEGRSMGHSEGGADGD